MQHGLSSYPSVLRVLSPGGLRPQDAVNVRVKNAFLSGVRDFRPSAIRQLLLAWWLKSGGAVDSAVTGPQ